MTQLHLGIMTGKELAAWFGISDGSFRNSKAKKLEELKNFATFEMCGAKVNILEIKEPYYSKQASAAFQKVHDEFEKAWDESGLDSCSRVGLQIKESLGNELAIKDGTVYEYTRKTRNELYGKPFMSGGTHGDCIYMWCKKIGEGVSAKYVALTEEEEKIKQDLMIKYYGNTTEKNLLVKGMVAAGEISKEEAWGVLEEMTGLNDASFFAFLQELGSLLGCTIVKGTMLQKNAFVIDECGEPVEE